MHMTIGYRTGPIFAYPVAMKNVGAGVDRRIAKGYSWNMTRCTTKGDNMDNTEKMLLVVFGVWVLWFSGSFLLAFAGYPGPLTDMLEMFHCLANYC